MRNDNWKPQSGEPFWVISAAQCGQGVDRYNPLIRWQRMAVESGNCFKTLDEAIAQIKEQTSDLPSPD